MQGLLINVFAKSEHLPYIDNVESQKTGTGLGGFWGNKGAVSIRMNLYNGSVTFVNMHLAAHDGMMGKRLKQFTKILLYHNYKTLHYIFDHDVVTILGDLNFRIKGIDNSESIINKVKNKNLYELLERDELRILLEHNKIFQCLNEVCPEFSPTFKYKVGTQSYNRKRRPAWCDRILHRALGKQARCIGFPVAYGTFLKVQQLSYRSHWKYVQSDHKPVSAEFLYKMERTSKCKYFSAEGDYIRPIDEL
ncbi:inositol polyphosphate 5-phosphatase K-like [Teleopsis dalmanni]|nr:inositol polyphosphate 5-phosphatase K-like [Teleopsis dalmanni]XP_037961017.1 inositol polyphosphate 5-phosphatase K-like [Teleopsis dalmanni]